LLKRSGGKSARDILLSIRRKNSANHYVNFEERVSMLRRKIDQMWKVSPTIVHPQVVDHVNRQVGIDFIVTERVKEQPEPSTQGFRQSDVFLKPFEAGICIEENLTKNHRLIFNKFPARQHHVLVITKEAESQSDKLNKGDF